MLGLSAPYKTVLWESQAEIRDTEAV
jgi:hypothetical protein